jgi:hypothetical protein
MNEGYIDPNQNPGAIESMSPEMSEALDATRSAFANGITIDTSPMYLPYFIITVGVVLVVAVVTVCTVVIMKNHKK